MNRLLTILLLLGATAHGQIDNPPTSVNIVDATATGRAVLTATNAAAARTSLQLVGSGFASFNSGSQGNDASGEYASTVGGALNTASGNYSFAAGRRAKATNEGAFVWADSQSGDFSSFSSNTFNVRASGGMSLDLSTNGISFRNLEAASATRTNLGLGATNDVTFSNVTVNGTLTAANIAFTNNYFTNPTTFATNVTVGGTLAATGNVTMSGVNNTMPGATNAASASSLMTRDFVGQEFANPRTKMQTTYWFGLEGLGLWQAVNSAVAVAAHRGPRFGPSLGFYAPSRSAVSAAGAGLRLGSTAITGSGAWAPVDGGAFTIQTQVVNYYAPPSANLAFGFFMGSGDNTNFWGNSNSIGLYCVQQPTNSWASNAVVTQHSRIAVSNVVWIVSTAGTNDATGPTWTDLIGSLVTNGSAVYRNLGPHTSNNWVLATGGTNASQIVMTNTGKSNWIIPSQGEAVLKLRYGTNTSAPFTFFATVSDGSGESAEVSLATPTNSARLNPQYWLRHDSTNAALGNDAAGIRYFAIDATLTPLTSP